MAITKLKKELIENLTINRSTLSTGVLHIEQRCPYCGNIHQIDMRVEVRLIWCLQFVQIVIRYHLTVV